MRDWSIRDIAALTGKLALVTGATGGLGFETAAALAEVGADVVLLGRNNAKGRIALERLACLFPSGTMRFQHVDLASLASVNACAAALIDQARPIDLLVNNAGVMALPNRKTSFEGYELQFATNHLGHFLLTARLLPLLRRALSPRVVSVSSLAHRMGAIDFNDLQGERRYDPGRAYAQSKLANLMFAFELQRRSQAADWGVTSLAAHPGVSNTDLLANGPGTAGLFNIISHAVARALGQSAACGALPILFAATSRDVEPAGYYGPGGLFELKGAPVCAHVAARAKNGDAAARLWDASVRLTGAEWP